MFTFSRNGLSGAARGAKSIVNRMGRGIAGVGRAGVDSVARNDIGKARLFRWISDCFIIITVLIPGKYDTVNV